MAIQIDVAGPGKWELAYADTRVAPDTRLRFRGTQARLIDPFDVPVIFHSHILAIGSSYKEAKATWFNCADIIQLAVGAFINDPGIWGDNYLGTEPIIIDRKRLRLNQSLELFMFTPVASDLRIGISPMPWIPRFSFGIYEFTGVATDSLEEKIDAARVQLAAIEAKI